MKTFWDSCGFKDGKSFDLNIFKLFCKHCSIHQARMDLRDEKSFKTELPVTRFTINKELNRIGEEGVLLLAKKKSQEKIQAEMKKKEESNSKSETIKKSPTRNEPHYDSIIHGGSGPDLDLSYNSISKGQKQNDHSSDKPVLNLDELKEIKTYMENKLDLKSDGTRYHPASIKEIVEDSGQLVYKGVKISERAAATKIWRAIEKNGEKNLKFDEIMIFVWAFRLLKRGIEIPEESFPHYIMQCNQKIFPSSQTYPELLLSENSKSYFESLLSQIKSMNDASLTKYNSQKSMNQRHIDNEQKKINGLKEVLETLIGARKEIQNAFNEDTTKSNEVKEEKEHVDYERGIKITKKFEEIYEMIESIKEEDRSIPINQKGKNPQSNTRDNTGLRAGSIFDYEDEDLIDAEYNPFI